MGIQNYNNVKGLIVEMEMKGMQYIGSFYHLLKFYLDLKAYVIKMDVTLILTGWEIGHSMVFLV